MDYEAQLRLQAFLDGELPEGKAREVSDWVAGDREAEALLEELRGTRKALGEFGAMTLLPESREFFWSKVQREIQRLERRAADSAPVPLLARLRRFVVPAFAFALVVLSGVVLTQPGQPFGRAITPGFETALADAGAFTYHDYSAGTTLVWLSYPADSEMSESDEMGTME
jgi:anti-sigma factor RsiW